jgi:Secretion system C-terminal sorting domain
VNQPLTDPVGVRAPSPFAVSVSPNPTVGQVVVSLPKGSQQATVEVTDLHGRTVIPAQTVQRERHTLQLSGLASGSYVIVVRDRKGISSVKVIKE